MRFKSTITLVIAIVLMLIAFAIGAKAQDSVVWKSIGTIYYIQHSLFSGLTSEEKLNFQNIAFVDIYIKDPIVTSLLFRIEVVDEQENIKMAHFAHLTSETVHPNAIGPQSKWHRISIILDSDYKPSLKNPIRVIRMVETNVQFPIIIK